MDDSLGENAGCVLFVGSIPASASREEVEAYFSNFGEIVAALFLQKKQRKRSTQRNPGHCQVITRDLETSNKILKHECHIFQGRRIVCQPFRKGCILKKNNQFNNQRRIIVKSLPAHYTDHDLRMVFRAFGDIDVCFIINAKNPKGIEDSTPDSLSGSIQFKSQVDAQKLLVLQTVEVDGVNVFVEPYRHDYSRAKPSQKGSEINLNRPLLPHTTLGPTGQVGKELSEYPLMLQQRIQLQQPDYLRCTSSKYQFVLEHSASGITEDRPIHTQGLDTQFSTMHHIKPTLKIYHVGRRSCPLGSDLRFNLLHSQNTISKNIRKPGVSGCMVGTALTLSPSVSNRSTRRLDI